MAAERVNLLDFDREQLTRWCDSLGEKPFRAVQLTRWIHRNLESDFSKMTNLAKSFREKLEAMAEVRPPEPMREQISSDGTRKWAFDVGQRATPLRRCISLKWTAVRSAFRRRRAARWAASSARPANRVLPAT